MVCVVLGAQNLEGAAVKLLCPKGKEMNLLAIAALPAVSMVPLCF